jgi:Ca-activated chloride channel homolog
MGRPFQLLVFVAFLVGTTVVSAQFRVDVQLVNLIATVTDSRGHYVAGLSSDDFIVEEDGIPQKISHFSQDQQVPVSIGVVLDTSGSMERKIHTAVDAVDRFIRRVHEDDEIFIVTFSSEPVLRQEFTSDRDKLSRALRKIPVTGGTALYDAVGDSLVRIREARHDKRAILVITDGQDTSSTTKLDQLLLAIRESELLVYSLGISPLNYVKSAAHVPFSWPLPRSLGGRAAVSSKRDDVQMNVLRSFAENSGGSAFLLADTFISGRGTQIEKVLDTIADELRSQYTLAYYPSRSGDDQYHSIRIRVKGGFTVRSRHGYSATRNP